MPELLQSTNEFTAKEIKELLKKNKNYLRGASVVREKFPLLLVETMKKNFLYLFLPYSSVWMVRWNHIKLKEIIMYINKFGITYMDVKA